MRVLLVEDEVGIDTLLRRGLDAAGLADDWVTTGDEALDRAETERAGRPDVVLPVAPMPAAAPQSPRHAHLHLRCGHAPDPAPRP